MKNIILLVSVAFSFNAIAQLTLTNDSLHYEDISVDTGIVSPINFPNQDTNRTKLIYWVHGLAGNSSSWNRVQETTDGITPISSYPSRNSEGYVANYQGEEGRRMTGLASWVHDNMEIWRNGTPRRDTLPHNEDILIAHSQGGIVSRTIRERHLSNQTRYPIKAGQLATFGTPNGGAYIINTTRPIDGEVQAWINDGCDALSDALVQDFVGSKWWLDAIITPSMIQGFTSKACDGLDAIVLPMLVNSIRKPVGQDYAIGSTHIAKLDSIANIDTMRVVTFFGVEEDPVFWRVLHTMTHTSDSTLSGNILFNDPFGLNDDDEFPNFVNGMIQDYATKEQMWRARAGTWNWLPWNWHAGEKAEIYDEAKTWLEGANPAWKRFIGARHDSAYQDGYKCFCGFGNAPYEVSSIIECYSSCPPSWFGTGQIPTMEDLLNYFVGYLPNIKHVITEEPSDGVVPVASQIDYPGARRWRMDNTNHMQERNCTQTRDRLNELFNGDHGRAFRVYTQ